MSIINTIMINKFGDASAEKPIVADILGNTEELFFYDDEKTYSLEDAGEEADLIGDRIELKRSSLYSVVFVHSGKDEGATVNLEGWKEGVWEEIAEATLTGASGTERVQIEEDYESIRATITDWTDGVYSVYVVRNVSDDLTIEDFEDYAIVYDHEDKTTGATIKFQYYDELLEEWTDSQTATLTGAEGREVVDIDSSHASTVYRVIVTAYTDGEYVISKVRTKIPFTLELASSNYHLLFKHAEKDTGAVLAIEYYDYEDEEWKNLETATLTGAEGSELFPVTTNYSDLRISLTNWVDGDYGVYSMQSTSKVLNTAGYDSFTLYFKHSGKTTGATVRFSAQDVQGDWHIIKTATLSGAAATEIMQFSGPYSTVRSSVSSYTDGVYSILLEALK